MFYEPDKKNHGLKFSPYKSCIVPRPIGWISTVGRDGRVNLAPYSQFNTMGYEPGYLAFSVGTQFPDDRRKNTLVNIEETGEFVYNMATYALRDAVNRTAQIVDDSVDELAAAGLTPKASQLVSPPRVGESPISIECRHFSTITLPGETARSDHYLVIGRVLGIHIDDSYINTDGKIDVLRMKPLARLGYLDYTTVESSFELDVQDDVREHFTWSMGGGR